MVVDWLLLQVTEYHHSVDLGLVEELVSVDASDALQSGLDLVW